MGRDRSKLVDIGPNLFDVGNRSRFRPDIARNFPAFGRNLGLIWAHRPETTLGGCISCLKTAGQHGPCAGARARARAARVRAPAPPARPPACPRIHVPAGHPRARHVLRRYAAFFPTGNLGASTRKAGADRRFVPLNIRRGLAETDVATAVFHNLYQVFTRALHDQAKVTQEEVNRKGGFGCPGG